MENLIDPLSSRMEAGEDKKSGLGAKGLRQIKISLPVKHETERRRRKKRRY